MVADYCLCHRYLVDGVLGQGNPDGVTDAVVEAQLFSVMRDFVELWEICGVLLISGCRTDVLSL
mgnify:CR=1 FL=1